MDTILTVNNLHVHFFTRQGVTKVLNGIDFSIKKRETLGIVGESDSGKTVLSNALVNLIKSPGKIIKGSVVFKGENLLEKSFEDMQIIRGNSVNIIVPNPKSAMNPIEPIGKQMENIYHSHFNVKKEKAKEKIIQVLKEVGINDAEKRYFAFPHELSGGMAKRIIIATALMTSPELLIADEPTFGLDVTIQRQVLEKFGELIRTNNMTTMIFTRDLSIIAHYCQKVAIIYNGRLIEVAPVKTFFECAKHPYSNFLLGSTQVDVEKRKYISKFNEVQDKFNLPPEGCVFQNCCKFARPICKQKRPELREIEENHKLACNIWPFNGEGE